MVSQGEVRSVFGVRAADGISLIFLYLNNFQNNTLFH